MKKLLSFEELKETLNVDKEPLQDTFDPDNGVAVIHKKNLNKYLEEFMCKNEEDLSNFLYYRKGIFLKVI